VTIAGTLRENEQAATDAVDPAWTTKALLRLAAWLVRELVA
jgi:hypothetical protein